MTSQTYESSRDAEDAVRDMDNRRFDGSRLIVEFARERNLTERPQRYGSHRSLLQQFLTFVIFTFTPNSRQSDFRMLVEGLPRDTSWQDLKDHVRSAGDCLFVNTVDGGTRGVVDYRDRSELDKAVSQLNGSTFRSEKVRCYIDPACAAGGGGGSGGGGSGSAPAARSRSPSPSKRRSSRSRSRSASPKRSRSRSRSRSPSPSKKAKADSPR